LNGLMMAMTYFMAPPRAACHRSLRAYGAPRAHDIVSRLRD
jgi:hypothetical protein